MSDSSPQMKVLISGAGIAGPCLAYWLSKTKSNPSITVVERSPVPRPTGQSIDIRGSAISIIKKMGLEDAVRSRHTTEEGTRMVYSDGRIIAEFGRGHNFTAVYEILRADLCGLFLDATKDLGNVEYVYGDYVTGLEQSENNVAVTFNSGKKETYDLVVGADGATSKIRSMVLDKDTLQDSYKFIGQYVAYFSIPSRDTDTKHWYWYNEPNGIGMMTRPHRTPDTIGCYMCITMPAHGIRDQEVEDALEAGSEEQRRVLHKKFAKSGWEAKRILEGMDQASDFYMSRAAQVKLPRWHKGRTALLGDAAHATFGVGTSLAIEGAYMLAGEITKIASNDEIPVALDTFEEKFRARYVKSEDLPPFFPQFGFPQTAWGLRLRDTALWIASKTKIYKLLPGDDEGKEEPVPDYDWIE